MPETDYLTLFKSMEKLPPPEIANQVFTCPPDDESRRLVFVRFACETYKSKWGWGARGEYLYHSLVRAIGLDHYEDDLKMFIEAKRGRKEEKDLAIRIWTMKAQGKTVPQMKAIFRSEGQYFSTEKIESYLKKRRKRSW